MLKRGGGRGRPDFTIVFAGGGGGGPEKNKIKSLKPYEATGVVVGVGESILHCKKKKRNKLERKKEKLDQRKLEVIQPKIKNKSNPRPGVFFRDKRESRRTVKGEKKRTSGTE